MNLATKGCRTMLVGMAKIPRRGSSNVALIRPVGRVFKDQVALCVAVIGPSGCYGIAPGRFLA